MTKAARFKARGESLSPLRPSLVLCYMRRKLGPVRMDFDAEAGGETMVTTDPWLIFNRMRWGSVVMSDEQLCAWGDEHFLKTGDPNHQTRWTKIKQRADAEGRSLAEICDEVAKQEGDPLVLLGSPVFSWPESSAESWKAAEVQKTTRNVARSASALRSST